MPKSKDNGRILKATRQRNKSHIKESTLDHEHISQQKSDRPGSMSNIFKVLKEKVSSKYTIPSKDVLKMEGYV